MSASLSLWPRLTIITLSGFLLTACTETEYISHLWKRGEQSYSDDQYTYTNSSNVAASSGNRPNQEGLYKVGKPYQAMGKWYTPTESYSYDETGIASWYGPGFHGKRTANGEPYDSMALTAAHPTLQLPCVARVTNLDNGRSIVVRVNDRGPFKRGRVMDVSKRAAELLGMIGAGTAKVRVQVLDQESRIVAEAARKGLPPHVQMAMAFKRQEAGVQVASADTHYNNSLRLTQDNPGREVSNVSQVDLQQVRKYPVHKTNIYVQVGSFSDAGNAQKLASRLGSLGTTSVSSANVNGRNFNRVRIGPVASVEEADRLLSRTVSAGHPGARIIVE
ncbi:MAG TPA: septal ring lytic transglycosylase RlpA family protein [Alphaproteobacteria bacterium]